MHAQILLIEDVTEILENIIDILQLRRIHVITATNGRTGIELASRFKPDLILCDILIPEVNGYDVLKFVRTTDGLQAIPFMFLTSQSERDDIKRALDLGASGYIVKPFDGELLINRVEALLMQHRQQAIKV